MGSINEEGGGGVSGVDAIARAGVASNDIDIATVKNDGLFMDETTLSPLLIGDPTLTEVEAFALGNTLINGLVYYTADDLTTSPVLRVYWIDDNGKAFLITSEHDNLGDHLATQALDLAKFELRKYGNQQTTNAGTSFAVGDDELGGIVVSSNAGAVTVTVDTPTNATAGQITVINNNPTQVTTFVNGTATAIGDSTIAFGEKMTITYHSTNRALLKSSFVPTVNDRLFADDTSVAPASAGTPTITEITTFAGVVRDTIIFYTGTDTETDSPTYVYHIDNTGDVTLLNSPSSTANNHVFADDTTVAPATALTPTIAEITAFVGLAVDLFVFYTGTDTATDPVTYIYHVDQAGDVKNIKDPANDETTYGPSTLITTTGTTDWNWTTQGRNVVLSSSVAAETINLFTGLEVGATGYAFFTTTNVAGTTFTFSANMVDEDGVQLPPFTLSNAGDFKVIEFVSDGTNIGSLVYPSPTAEAETPWAVVNSASALDPARYLLDGTAGSFAVTLTQAIGEWEFSDSVLNSSTNAITVGTALQTFTDNSGAQVAGPLLIDSDGAHVKLINIDGGVNFTVVREPSLSVAGIHVANGSYDAATNTPDLTLAVNQGDGTSVYTYLVTVSGTQDLGQGSTLYEAGGQITYYDNAGTFRYDAPSEESVTLVPDYADGENVVTNELRRISNVIYRSNSDRITGTGSNEIFNWTKLSDKPMIGGNSVAFNAQVNASYNLTSGVTAFAATLPSANREDANMGDQILFVVSRDTGGAGITFAVQGSDTLTRTDTVLTVGDWAIATCVNAHAVLGGNWVVDKFPVVSETQTDEVRVVYPTGTATMALDTFNEGSSIVGGTAFTAPTTAVGDIGKKFRVYNTGTAFALYIPPPTFTVTGYTNIQAGEIVEFWVTTATNTHGILVETFDEVFTGATVALDGTAGNVTQPLVADREKFLRADGTWSYVPNEQVVAGGPTSTIDAELGSNVTINFSLNSTLQPINNIVDGESLVVSVRNSGGLAGNFGFDASFVDADGVAIPTSSIAAGLYKQYIISSANGVSVVADLSHLAGETLFTDGLTQVATNTVTADALWTFNGTGDKTVQTVNGAITGTILTNNIGAGITATDGTETSSLSTVVDGTLQLNSTTGAYELTTTPLKDSDLATNELVSRNTADGLLKTVDNARFENIVGLVAPVDGTTIAYYIGQLYINTVSGDKYISTSKSTDPDAAGTGSVFALVPNSTAPWLTETINTVGTFVGDGNTQKIYRFGGGATASTLTLTATIYGLGAQVKVQNQASANGVTINGGGFLFRGSTPSSITIGIGEIATFTVSTGGFWAVEIDQEDVAIVEDNLRSLSGAGAPVNGTTTAWFDGQIYIDTTSNAIYIADTASTSPSTAPTGSQFSLAPIIPATSSSAITVDGTFTPVPNAIYRLSGALTAITFDRTAFTAGQSFQIYNRNSGAVPITQTGGGNFLTATSSTNTVTINSSEILTVTEMDGNFLVASIQTVL